MNKKFLKNPWFIGIGTSIIATIISDSFGITKIMSSIWSAIKWVSNLIIHFLLIKFQESTEFLNFMSARGYDLVDQIPNKYSADYTFKKRRV